MIRISEAERQVMEALWAASPTTPDELVRRVAPAQGWGDATVKTLVNRLLKKGAIASRRLEGRTLYEPVLQRDAYVESESQGLLDRLFGGQASSLIAHLVHRRSLSEDERARLRRMLDELDRE